MRTTLAILTTAALVIGGAACRADEDRPGETPRDAVVPGEANPEQAGTPQMPAPGASSQPDAKPGAPASAPPAPAPKTVVTNETLTVFGAPRAYVLAVPTTYTPSRAYPLVLVLHGDGADGAAMRGVLAFDEHTGADAIVAYPSGGFKSWDLQSANDQNKDLALITDLVTSLSGRFTIDATRVFASGFSSGAFMVNQVACRKPTLLRGIAAHSGGAPAPSQDPSSGTWPNGYAKCGEQPSGVAALVVHGTDDAVVAPQSGDFAAKYWAYVNGCANVRTASAPAPCVRHDGCPAGKPVLFCGIGGLGHGVWNQAGKADWAFFGSL